MIEQHRKTKNGVLQGSKHTTLMLNHKERNRVIMECCSRIRSIEFDSIVVSGVSGLLVGPQIAEILDKNIVVVRKKNEKRYSHNYNILIKNIVVVRKKNEKRYSPFHIEGAYPGDYIVVDDLVCSGSTIKRIFGEIKSEYPRSKAMGVYCYIPEDCGYSNCPEIFKREFGVEYLNPCE